MSLFFLCLNVSKKALLRGVLRQRRDELREETCRLNGLVLTPVPISRKRSSGCSLAT